MTHILNVARVFIHCSGFASSAAFWTHAKILNPDVPLPTQHLVSDNLQHQLRQPYGQAESFVVARGRAVIPPYESSIVPSLATQIKATPEHVTPSRSIPQVSRDSHEWEVGSGIGTTAPLEPPLDMRIKPQLSHFTPPKTLPEGIRDSLALEADLEMEMMRLKNTAAVYLSGYMTDPVLLQDMSANKTVPEANGDKQNNDREQSFRQPVASEQSLRQPQTAKKRTNNTDNDALEEDEVVSVVLDIGLHALIILGVWLIYVFTCGRGVEEVTLAKGLTADFCIGIGDCCSWCAVDWYESDFNMKMLYIILCYVIVEGFYLLVRYGYLNQFVPILYFGIVAFLLLLVIYYDIRGKVVKEYREGRDEVDDAITMITGEIDEGIAWFENLESVAVNEFDDEATTAQKGKDTTRAILKGKASALRAKHIAKVKQKQGSARSTAPSSLRMC